MKRTTALKALLAFSCAPAAAQAHTLPETRKPVMLSRERVTSVIAARRRIVSGEGIEELTAIPVNGVRQWLSIRGCDTRNPVLLFLHGGPGSPTMPEAWTFQSPWEDYFTVVQWDQRGSGKTYASNDPAALAPTMTADQMIRDAESVVDYLRARFHKRKIFVLGHSWGSYLGLNVARRRPDSLHAYIGTGQIVDMLASEAEGYSWALDRATAHGNAEAVGQLRSISPYPGSAGLTIERVGTQRTWLTNYGGLAYGRSDFQWDADAWHLAPEYSEHDLQAIDRGGLYSLQHLLPALAGANFERETQFDCPMFLFMGRHDRTTSYAIAQRWFRRVRAPQKAFVTFERSAHMAMLEEPGRYLHHLVSRVRPIAVRAGDAPPDENVET